MDFVVETNALVVIKETLVSNFIKLVGLGMGMLQNDPSAIYRFSKPFYLKNALDISVHGQGRRRLLLKFGNAARSYFSLQILDKDKVQDISKPFYLKNALDISVHGQGRRRLLLKFGNAARSYFSLQEPQKYRDFLGAFWDMSALSRQSKDAKIFDNEELQCHQKIQDLYRSTKIKIARKENFDSSMKLASKIATQSKQNLKKAIMALEACKNHNLTIAIQTPPYNSHPNTSYKWLQSILKQSHKLRKLTSSMTRKHYDLCIKMLHVFTYYSFGN
ncbi:hypothetical protein Tco_0790211 [Tanacetum coccineum]